METVKPLVIAIEGNIYTDAEGVDKLMQLYHEAAQYRDVQINVDFYGMTWFDANLAALFRAITYKLMKENNVGLSADFNFLSQNFDVLFKNGFLQDPNYNIADVHETTIPCAHFLPSQESEFIEYIDKKLMCHHSLGNIDGPIKKRVQADLLEVFQNLRHARTKDPSFICGQFYPKKKYFILSMVDLGIGFLEPIREYTGGEVSSDIDAIRWALSGQSSAILDPKTQIGGFGLQGILEYAISSKGIFQIYTGADFWGTDLENTVWEGCRPLKHSLQGSLLNLFFKF